VVLIKRVVFPDLEEKGEKRGREGEEDRRQEEEERKWI